MGAPQGNQNAKKAQRRRGISISYYLRADPYEFLKECLDFEIGDSSDGAIRKRVDALIEEAIKQEMRRILALYKSKQESKE